MKKTKNRRTVLTVLQGLLSLVILAAMFSNIINLTLLTLMDLVVLQEADPEEINQLIASQEAADPEELNLQITVRDNENPEDDELTGLGLEIEGEGLEPLQPFAVAMYACLCLLFLLMAFSIYSEWKPNLLRYGIGSLFFAACAGLFLFTDLGLACRLSAVLHAAALCVDHVFSIVKDHRVRNIVSRGLCILLLLSTIVLQVVSGNAALLTVLIMTIPRIFYYIVRISFSRVKMDVLRRIVRKTYAAEILFGMLMLIIAFSITLPNLEGSIPTFGDALWYCFSIVTTIGFGDYAALTIPGRILSVILGLYGIIVVALITSIIVNFYNETKNSVDEDEMEEPEAAEQ